MDQIEPAAERAGASRLRCGHGFNKSASPLGRGWDRHEEQAVMDQKRQLKEEICQIGQRVWQRGFCAGNEGNISVRLDPDRVLCTPTGMSKGFLTPEMICVSDYEGNHLEPEPGYSLTSEVKVHLALYKARPEAKAVIHCHPPHVVAFALAGICPPQKLHPEVEVFIGEIAFAPYQTPGTHELAQGMIDQLKPGTNTVILANHGLVCFCDTLTQAYYNVEIMDNYCKALLLAQSLKTPEPLGADKFKELMAIKQKMGIKDHRM